VSLEVDFSAGFLGLLQLLCVSLDSVQEVETTAGVLHMLHTKIHALGEDAVATNRTVFIVFHLSRV